MNPHLEQPDGTLTQIPPEDPGCAAHLDNCDVIPFGKRPSFMHVYVTVEPMFMVSTVCFAVAPVTSGMAPQWRTEEQVNGSIGWGLLRDFALIKSCQYLVQGPVDTLRVYGFQNTMYRRRLFCFEEMIKGFVSV